MWVCVCVGVSLICLFVFTVFCICLYCVFCTVSFMYIYSYLFCLYLCKYKGLTIEIQSIWNVKTRVIPVIIGATVTISKSFRKYVSDIPGNHDVMELQKQPYWALQTYFVKCYRKRTKEPTLVLDIEAP